MRGTQTGQETTQSYSIIVKDLVNMPGKSLQQFIGVSHGRF